MSRHQDDTSRRASAAPVLRHERPAVHDRHRQIEQDELRLDLSDQLEGSGAVAHGRDRVARLAQRLAQDVGKLVIVVDHQHPRVMTVRLQSLVSPHRPPAGTYCRTDANGSLGRWVSARTARGRVACSEVGKTAKESPVPPRGVKSPKRKRQYEKIKK